MVQAVAVQESVIDGIRCIDLSSEVTPILRAEDKSSRAWAAADIDPTQCIVPLGDCERAELANVVHSARDVPLPMLLRRPEHFEMPRCEALMDSVAMSLKDGPGVAVIDALPLDDWESDGWKRDDITTLYWIMGQRLSRPVAQKWDGTMLYDVKDTGQDFGYGVRGSYTNIELNFHTDNAFGIAPPHYVGLLCLYPAQSGGVSRFCSLYRVHNEMLRAYPRELERLYRPMLMDRQAEHKTGAPRFSHVPMFRWDGQRLAVRINTGLVRNAYMRADVTPGPELAGALDALDEILEDSALLFELPLERGQIQYLNNLEVAHYRSEFIDDPDPQRKRHLLRTWHRESGAPSYDG